MPLSVLVDLGHRPKLDDDDLLAIVKEGLGDRHEVYDPGRLAPSIASRPWKPAGLARQVKLTAPLLDEVVSFLEGSARLR